MISSLHLATGTVVAGDYTILRELEIGSTRAVYVARQASTGYDRALKVMQPQLVGDERLRQRFQLEATTGARIRSEHVVHVVGAGVDPATGLPFIATELLEGCSLGAFLARAAVPPADARELVAQIGRVLGAAHAAGVVHGDLKPDNLFLADARDRPAGFVLKVLDFGIARLVADTQGSGANAVMGAAAWMAPEQATRSAPLGPAADVWALGLIAFTLFTGQSYWRSSEGEAGTPTSLMREILFDEIVPSSVRAQASGRAHLLPQGFDAWLQRCLVRDPAARFSDGGEAVAALLPVIDRHLLSSPSASPHAWQGRPSVRDLVSAPDAPPPTTRDPRMSAPHAAAAPPPVEVLAYSATPSPAPAYAMPAQSQPPLVVWGPPPGHGEVGAGAGAMAMTPPGLVPPPPPVRASKRSPAGPIAGAIAALALVAGGFFGVRAFTHKNASDAAKEGWAALESRDGPDYERARTKFEKGCDGSAQDGCAGLGQLRRLGRGVTRDLDKALSLLRTACDEGSSRGCAGLAEMYENGEAGLAKDAATAARHYQRACDDGIRPSCARLGALLAEGAPGVPQDGARAAELLERACEDDAHACALAGGLLEHRRGATSKEEARAKALYEKGCDGRDANACTALGAMMDEGRGGAMRDDARAVAYHRDACDAGNQVACARLARAYDAGRGGLVTDEGRASALYRAACDAKVGRACAELGLIYRRGKPAAPAETRAGELLRQACDLHDTLGCGVLDPRTLGIRVALAPDVTWISIDPLCSYVMSPYRTALARAFADAGYQVVDGSGGGDVDAAGRLDVLPGRTVDHALLVLRRAGEPVGESTVDLVLTARCGNFPYGVATGLVARASRLPRFVDVVREKAR